jgi:chromosome segregation ATPase
MSKKTITPEDGMEIEQLEKRLEWLDDERRKDKSTIATLENKIEKLEDKLNASKKEVSTLTGSLSQFNLVFGKIEQLEKNLAETKIDLGKIGEGLERSRKESEHEQELKRISDMDGITSTILEIRKITLPIPDLKKGQKIIDTDISVLKQQVQNLDNKFVSNQEVYDEYQRAQKMFDDSRKTENKRITDLQGEISAYRKRGDELRSKIDLALENMRNIEARIIEITASETDRRQSQVAFMEKQNQQQVIRERTLKDGMQKIEQVTQNSALYEAQFKNLEDTLRTIRKTKDQLEDATQKIDRRVNEITEMHRLNEDHFRQEWITFKADDQKRWANYNLIMDEQQKDNQRQEEKLDKRVVHLEDLTLDMSDTIANIHNETEKRMQNLLSLAHDWLSSYERLLGKDRELD